MLKGFHLLAQTEGILPALEPAHAIAYLMKQARALARNAVVVVGLSGRGDKDVEQIANIKGQGARGRGQGVVGE